MFRIEMVPAKHGDCIFIEYGEAAKRSRILIDGGPTNAADDFKAHLDAMPVGAKDFELLVVSHVDTDHIEGIIRFLRSADAAARIHEIWFNGWNHLTDKLGGKQGEFLDALIEKAALDWNKTGFGGRAVRVADDGAPPMVKLKGGMELTILSPSKAKLQKLKKEWESVVKAAGWKPGDTGAALTALDKARGLGPLDQLGDWVKKYSDAKFEADTAAANGSSIAFLAEYGGASCLLLADAHMDVVVDSLKRVLADRHENRLKVDAIKLAHHGSRHNLNKDLLDLVRCKRFLVSTNGDKFGHPDVDSIARVVRYGGPNAEIYFNYAHTKKEYGKAEDMQTFVYKAVYPAGSAGGITIDLKN